MPVSTLNRIVSMFIVGGVPVVWYVLHHFDWFELPPDSPVLTGFILIPVTATFGAVAEGVADFWRELIIKPAGHDRKLAVRYRAESGFDKLLMWRTALKALMKDDRIKLVDAVTLCPSTPPSVRLNDYAAGVVLKNGSKEQVDWVNAHHSAYALASALAVVCFCVGAAELVYQACTSPTFWLFPEAFGIGLVCYLMTCFATDMWLYSYVIACRFAALQLLEEKPKL